MFACFGKYSDADDMLKVSAKALEKEAKRLEKRSNKDFKKCKKQIIKGARDGCTFIRFMGYLSENHMKSLRQDGYRVYGDGIHYNISWYHVQVQKEEDQVQEDHALTLKEQELDEQVHDEQVQEQQQ
jgi:hypothetical protein